MQVQLELIKDRTMHDMIDRGVRGGISVISHRRATANNPNMTSFDTTKPSSFIIYLDANNLYGHVSIINDVLITAKL